MISNDANKCLPAKQGRVFCTWLWNFLIILIINYFIITALIYDDEKKCDLRFWPLKDTNYSKKEPKKELLFFIHTLTNNIIIIQTDCEKNLGIWCPPFHVIYIIISQYNSKFIWSWCQLEKTNFVLFPKIILKNI